MSRISWNNLLRRGFLRCLRAGKRDAFSARARLARMHEPTMSTSGHRDGPTPAGPAPRASGFRLSPFASLLCLLLPLTAFADTPSFIARDVTATADGAVSVSAIDLDDDGDMDLLSATIDDNKITWHENDGSENFTERVISTSANAAQNV